MHAGKIITRLFGRILVSFLLVAVGAVGGYRIGIGQRIPVVSTIIDTNFPKASQVINVEVPARYAKQIDFSQFWEVWGRLEANYVDPEKLDPQKMVYGAIEGMTNAIGDPYTVYLPPEAQKRSEEDLGGEFSGVGIQLGYKDKILAVMAPIKGTPADKAGVKAGDYIVHIKDEDNKIDRDTSDISLPEAVSIIRGKKGTKITLTIVRSSADEKNADASKPREITLVRDTILVPSVELTMVERDGKKYAHLVLSKFGDKTQDEWDAAVKKIVADKSNIEGIVLDLRNNTGGYLQGAIDIASDFIKDGVIVIQQGRTMKQEYTVSKYGKLLDFPVVVLVNGGTASASEILSGALRDRNKVKLVGEKTFGKGTVQDAMNDLPNNAGLHITIAKWLLPSGEWIHEKGIEPNVAVQDDEETEDVDEVFERGIQELQK